jgi:chromosome segregation ATPase
MSSPTRRTLILFTCTWVLGPGLHSATAQDSRRENYQERQRALNEKKRTIRSGITAHQKAIEQAKAANAAAAQTAAAAQVKVQAAQQQIATAVSHVKRLEEHVDSVTANLQAIERGLIDELEEDSKLRQAIADVEAAEEAFALVRQTAFASPAYKAAYQRALVSVNKEEELPRVRKQFIDDHQELQAANAALSVAREKLEALRQETFGAEDEFVQAVAAVRAAKSELVKANQTLSNGLLSKTSAASIYRGAVAAAQQAAAAQQRSEAAIKRLQSQEKGVTQQQRREQESYSRSGR